MDRLFRYLPHADLVFHVLAHMRVQNPSDLFSPVYIQNIQPVRKLASFDLSAEIKRLEDGYNRDFQRLGIINFLPFFCEDLPELESLLLQRSSFTQDDLRCFVRPFIDILEREAAVYLPYWRDRHRAQADWIRQVEQELRLQLTTYAPVFQYFQKMPAVCLSMSLTRNGRGYTDLSGRFAAAAPLPQREEDIPNAFFTLLHEFTHQFTDDLLEMDINMRDGSHNLAENAVIVTDCELVEAIAPASLTAYLLWLGSLSGHDTALPRYRLLEIFPLPPALYAEIRRLLDNILT